MIKDADVLTLQETHIPEGERKRLMRTGFKMIDYIGHIKHGIATFVNQNINQQIVKKVEGNEHTNGIRIGDIPIFNVYKPPSSNWSNSVLPSCQHPGVYIGDFNSHSTEWGYTMEDKGAERLVKWSHLNHTHLLYDAKQGGTFKSGRWGTSTNPDLCFVISDKSS